MFTATETISLVTALIALIYSVRANRVAREAIDLQRDAHQLVKADLAAKQTPKLQVTNETYLSNWQRGLAGPRCPPDQLDLVYSSVLTNKGDRVATLLYATIEMSVAPSPLASGRPGFAVSIANATHLAAGESMALNAIVTAQHLDLVRLFCQLPGGVVVSHLTFAFSGYNVGPAKSV